MPRQTSQNKTGADQLSMDIDESLNLTGVPGTIPLELRPMCAEFLEKAKKRGIVDIMVPDEQRLARKLVIQEEAIEYCEKSGCN